MIKFAILLKSSLQTLIASYLGINVILGHGAAEGVLQNCLQADTKQP